ncbi:hypothetical protein AWRI3579_g620 [Hanseniaspora osmophila]|uniref:Uncharacterized protein n=1 Tax=Hanseniaspora osmophila TaxID=56408 RepID=A0A1E5RN06_9ASCO|nr:hypothetical protein AWRI3579_g620 [Hanseniaspora osmophila]
MSSFHTNHKFANKESVDKHKTSTFNTSKKKIEYKGKKSTHCVTNNNNSNTESFFNENKNQRSPKIKDYCSKPKPKHSNNVITPNEIYKTKSISTQTDDRVSLQLFNMFKTTDTTGGFVKSDEENNKMLLENNKQNRAEIHKRRKNSNFSDTSTSSNQTLFDEFACSTFQPQPEMINDTKHFAGHDKSSSDGHFFPMNYYLNKETLMSFQNKKDISRLDENAIDRDISGDGNETFKESKDNDNVHAIPNDHPLTMVESRQVEALARLNNLSHA